MKFHILDLVIYGHEDRKRVISFSPGKLNIITGSSSTGKSTILKIVDYLLGRSTFNIPSGPIREKVLWYGIRLQVGHQQMFISKPRPAPGAASQQSVYLEEATELIIPDKPPALPNTNDDNLIEIISQRLGIEENATIVSEDSSRESFSVTSRHTTYYTFQDQGTVANPNVLFHRQSDEHQPQAIRDSLPYFLGVNDPDVINIIIKLRQKRRDLKIFSKSLYEKEYISLSNSDLALRLAGEAISSGIAVAPIPRDASQLMKYLRDALSHVATQGPENEREQALRERLILLRQKIAEVDAQLRSVRDYVSETIGYQHESMEQRARLLAIGIFEKSNHDTTCPLCSSVVESPPPAMASITKSLQRITSKLEGIERGSPRVRKMVEALADQREQFREEIREIEAELKSLLALSPSLNQEENALRIKGRISLFLETTSEPDLLTNLKMQIASLKREIERLEEAIGSDGKADKLFAAISEISQIMTPITVDLALEYAGFPHRIDIGRLTVIADAMNGPVIMGTTMGGGSNHLGCHIAALLGMHKYFLRHNRPVPGFLILDQPTQVYFPEGGDGETPKKNEDREAVLRLFRVINDFVNSCDGNLQVIVVDHARENDPVFNDNLADAPWRGGKGLVPSEWPNAPFK